jgi:probable F420-dependent oxidoreductase
MNSPQREIAVTLGLWQDRPAAEAIITARTAAELGFAELWIGEMATYDVFALATAIGSQAANLRLVLGPLAANVRDPMMIAMGAASVASLTGRPVDIALGTSSPLVVSEWHGRQRTRPLQAVIDSVGALRALLNGEKADGTGKVMSSRGYRLRLQPPASSVSIAAFGSGAVAAAAAHADRMVVNLVTASSAQQLAAQCEAVAAASPRPRPRVVAWVPVGIGDPEAIYRQVRTMLVAYIGAPGYADMFISAGFPDVVAFARTRPHPRELYAQIPDELIDQVAAIGDESAVSSRLKEYRKVVDEVAVLPCSTDADPAGVATLTAIAGMFEPAECASL